MKEFKVFRSLTALLLALSMLLGLGVSAFAAEPETAVEVLSTDKPATKAPVDATPEGIYIGFGNTAADQARYATALYGNTNFDDLANWSETHFASGNTVADGMFSGTLNGAGANLRACVGGTMSDATYVLDYTIGENDIFEIRYRFTDSTGTEVQTQHYIGLEESDGKVDLPSYNFGEKHAIRNGEFETKNYSLSKYAGRKLRTLQPTFRTVADGKLSIDYIYVGPAAKAPVEVSYYEGNTKLYSEFVGYGLGGTYQPAGSVSNNVLTYYNGWQATNGDFYSNASDIRATSAMKLTTKKDTLDPDEMMSNKYLSTGTDGADDKYCITLDAYSYGKPKTVKTASPLDITLVLDRSASMAAPADVNNTWKVSSTFTLDDIIAEMNKVRLEMGDDFYDGYFRASNWLQTTSSSAPYAGNKLYPHDGWGSWDPIRYRDYTNDGVDNGQWETFVVDASRVHWKDQAFGIIYFEKANQMYYGSWKEIHAAKTTHDTRMSKKSKSYAYEVAVPRLTMAINAISDFLDEINESTALLPEGEHHKVSILSYGICPYADGFEFYGDSSFKHIDFVDQGVSITSRTLDENYVDIMTTLRQYFVYGNTRTDYALEVIANTTTSSSDYVASASEYKNDYGYCAPLTEGRTNVVILLTDGVPTNDTNAAFRLTTADAAIAATKNLKQRELAVAGQEEKIGVSVYTIGFMADLNVADGIEVYADEYIDWDSDGIRGEDANGNFRDMDDRRIAESKNADTFLQLLSSNFPDAGNMSSLAFNANGKPTSSAYNRAADNFYLTDKGDGTDLAKNFETILSEVSTSTSALSNALAIHDELTREFKLDPAEQLSIYVSPYLGNGQFGERVLIGQHSLGDIDATFGQGVGYSVTWNSDEKDMTLIWTDAKYGYLRELDVETSGNYPQYKKGYKIIVEMPIAVDRDNTIGGNNIPTNKPASGLYNVDENGNIITEMDQVDASGNVIKVPADILTYPANDTLNANVSTDLELTPHDYFMNMSTLMKIFDLSDRTATIQDIFLNLISADISVKNSAGESKIDHVEEIRVTITDPVTGETVCTLVAKQGSTDFTVEWCVTNTQFNFLLDQTFAVSAEIVQKKDSTTDSVNVVKYGNEETGELAPNYIAPKFAIIDFDGVISVPMQKEADDARLTYVELEDDDNGDGVVNSKDFYGGTYDAESGCIKYDLRGTYGVGIQPLLQNKDYRVCSYTFEAINPRKGVTLTNGKDIVSRELLILPANVMTYDEMVLWGATNDWWKPTGTYVQGDQEFDNSLRHGYDKNFEDDTTDLHGSALFTTPNATYNNQTLTAEFWGTGFEVLSRTSPDSGAMLVEVRHTQEYNPETEETTAVNPNGVNAAGESAPGEIKKVFLVNNYLADETLYQVPVVQYDGLDYGVYRVNIYAYYNKAFDQHYKGVMTEEKAREILGLDESIDFTYIPSPSEGSLAKRNAAPETKLGQYNVYVDGLRVYNTRGDLTFMNSKPHHENMNKIFQYVYSLAGEYDLNTHAGVHIENFSDLIIDAESDVNWSAEGTEGVLYIAGHGEAENGDEANTATDGFMLNMSGKIDFVTEGGKNYPVKKNGEKYLYTYTYSYEDTKEDGTTETVEETASAPIYYKVNSDGTRDYYAVLKTGKNTEAETMLEWKVVRELLGQNGAVVYYNSKYDLMGPEHEIYIPAPNGSAYRGIAFNVENASNVRISIKAINGPIKLEAYNGSDWEAVVANYDSKTEMYFDVPVAGDAVILRNAGENVLSVCNIKMLGTSAEAAPLTFVKPNTMMMAINLFNNETPILDDGVQMAHSLTLESGISINYVAKAEQLDQYDSFYMEVVAPVYEGNDQVGTKTYRLDPIAEGNRYYFVMDEIAAKQMNDVLQARIYMTKDGVTYVSRLDEYSVATYAYKQLINAEASEELKAVCVNLLRYGAEAQKQWNYRTDALADEEIASEFMAYMTDLETVELESKMAMLNDLEAPTVSWKSAALALESKIVMRFTANLAGFEGKVEDLTARITFVNHEGGTVVATVKEFVLLDAEKKLYTVDCDAIDADEMRVVVSAAIYCGETQISRTAQYSVETYAARATEDIVTLCKAMIAYGDSVDAFFN